MIPLGAYLVVASSVSSTSSGESLTGFLLSISVIVTVLVLDGAGAFVSPDASAAASNVTRISQSSTLISIMNYGTNTYNQVILAVQNNAAHFPLGAIATFSSFIAKGCILCSTAVEMGTVVVPGVFAAPSGAVGGLNTIILITSAVTCRTVAKG